MRSVPAGALRHAEEKAAGRVYNACRQKPQWEYSCRAESTTAFVLGTTIVSLTDGLANSQLGGRPTRWARRSQMPWGLYDMHGNVWSGQDWENDELLGALTEGRSDGPKNVHIASTRGGVLVGRTRCLSVGGTGCHQFRERLQLPRLRGCLARRTRGVSEPVRRPLSNGRMRRSWTRKWHESFA